VFSCILLLYITRPPLKPSLKRKELFDLIGFGSGISFISIINYAAVNVDYFIIGKFLSTTALGLYTRAYRLMNLPRQLSTTLTSVLFPAYSEIQEESGRIAAAYFKAVNAIAIITFPIFVGMAICSEYIVVGLYGSNWVGAVTVLRIMCFAGILRSIFHLTGSVVQASGKIYSEAKRQFVYLILLVIGCLIGVRYGIEGIGFAIIFGSLWMYLSMAQLVLSILDSSWKTFLKAQLPGLIIASIIGVTD